MKRVTVRLVAGATLGLALALVLAYRVEAERSPGALLITPNRVDLRVCVEELARPAMAGGSAAGAVRAALEEIRLAPDFQSRYPGLGVRADVGCPSAPALLATQQKHPKNGGPVQAYPALIPSLYRTFVFVVDGSTISQMFAPNQLPLATQEHFCDPQCAEVTSALYVTSEQLDSPWLVSALRKAVGLERPLEKPTGDGHR